MKLKSEVIEEIKKNSSLRKELEDTLKVSVATIYRWIYGNPKRLLELTSLLIINKYMKYPDLKDLTESDIKIQNE